MTTALSAQPGAKEMAWHAHGLRYAGLAWGDPAMPPLLALHGWLDNAASFSLLAPLLQRHYVIALDLSGHGLTDHRSADASYQIWDDLPEIDIVTRALGWERFGLLGHSRGAVIATLLASAMPERVERLVLLDGLSPEPVSASQFPQQLRRALEDKPRLLARENRVYSDPALAIAAREKRGLSADAARIISERNFQVVPEGVTWRTDARLHGASAVKMTSEQADAVLQGLTMPTCLLLASDSDEGGQRWMADRASAHIPDVQIHTVSGGHHFHLEEGAIEAADRINKFMNER